MTEWSRTPPTHPGRYFTRRPSFPGSTTWRSDVANVFVGSNAATRGRWKLFVVFLSETSNINPPGWRRVELLRRVEWWPESVRAPYVDPALDHKPEPARGNAATLSNAETRTT